MTEYRDNVKEKYQLEADTNAEDSWKLEEICGATKGGKHLERETWWWNEEVQESLRRKRMHSRNGRCRVETKCRRPIS